MDCSILDFSKSKVMKLFLFGASVFYLLGLKVTTQTEFKTPIINKTIQSEPKVLPPKEQERQPEIKYELKKKEIPVSTETKSGKLTAPCVNDTVK